MFEEQTETDRDVAKIRLANAVADLNASLAKCSELALDVDLSLEAIEARGQCPKFIVAATTQAFTR